MQGICRRTLRTSTFLLAFWVALPPAIFAQQDRAPDITLRGNVTKTDAQTYREVPFTVPIGVTRITVDFSYTERDKKTSIDLGILDGERFRGWSGGNKNSFTISGTDATPSYLPGPIRPGPWKLLLGIPNIEKGIRSEFEAKIYFSRAGEQPATSTFSLAPLRDGPAWYRGDFHLHDAHSDGSCLSQNGVPVPCPLYKTVEVAASRKLDFIAISDHNTTSQYNQERELQPYFDRLLLIPAREITTFHGHANVFGTTDFVDFRLGTAAVPDVNTISQQVAALHGLISINHPGAPTGPSCMGCGWTAPQTDYKSFTAVEAINGGSMDGRGSGIPFWEERLNAGYRLAAIGGSDNHEAVYPAVVRSAIGHPITVVYANNLSERAILDGVRAGHVFVDLEGSSDRIIEFSAKSGTESVAMGDNLRAPEGQTIHFALKMFNLQESYPEVVHDEPNTLTFGEQMTNFDYRSDGKRHWFRVNVRSMDGRMLILGNPIYINF
ncbi:MAG: CehA/McbA family metallohydrolase [Acidobacteriaceae bacterium]